MKDRDPTTALLCRLGGVLALALTANACLAEQRPEWAFFVPAGNESPQLPPSDPKTQDVLNPPDWYPNEHPAMPAVVAHGSAPPDKSRAPLLPCALCHLPNGAGHVESASLAGLSADYIVRQFAEWKSGVRRINVGNAGAAQFLTTLKASYTETQVRAAAEYFASLEPRTWVRVRETRTVPRSVVNPATLMRLRIGGPGTEPLGNRIIELAEDDTKLIERDSHSGYVAYVPIGALARGKSLVAGSGRRTIACGGCHGAALTGLGDAPPLAGRPPNYLLRQLWSFQAGERTGKFAAPMQAVVAYLSVDEMLDIAAYTASLPPSVALSVNRDALRQIVQEQCVVHWLQQHSANPCERIYLPASPHEHEGFAVLADRKGGAHFLLIPTKTVGGMESAELLKPGTPNYFAAAWHTRDLLAQVVGHSVPRSAVGMALNPRHARSQDQLHIHIECVRRDVAASLQKAALQLTGTWVSVAVGGWTYDALRVMGDELDGADPFALLAASHPASSQAGLGDYTLVVSGMDFKDGPGFILLAGKGPAGELLLDSTCAIAATT
jgi:CDP-diacylglycerol diphosphatase